METVADNGGTLNVKKSSRNMHSIEDLTNECFETTPILLTDRPRKHVTICK